MASLRRRTANWNRNIPIFSPLLANFPRLIYNIMISMIRVRTFTKGGSLLGFPFSLGSFFHFRFRFQVFLSFNLVYVDILDCN